MPDPIIREYFGDKSSSTRYWGQIDGRVLDFQDVNDQILAYKWFIDQVRIAWQTLAPKHLQLAGFYILSEELVMPKGSHSDYIGWNYDSKRWDKILPHVSSYLHSFACGLYWIPYYKADGYYMSKQLGVDITYIQPNKYWDYNESKSWSWVFNTMSTYGHGMELEFEGTHGESGWSGYVEGVKRTSASILEQVYTTYEAEGRKPGQQNPYAERNKQLFRDYMNRFKEAGYYGKAYVATYSGTNAMVELATSSDPKDREMYLEYCKFITESPLRKK